MPPEFEAELDEIAWLDPKLARDALNLALLGDRNVALRDRDGEEAAQKGQPLLVSGVGREVSRHQEIVGAAEHPVAGAGQADDEYR